MKQKLPNPIDEHVGSRLQMRRVMLGMSQKKLGDALGLTYQQVQKYEKGSNRIGASRLQHIAYLLEVDVSFFFAGAPQTVGLAVRQDDAQAPAYDDDHPQWRGYVAASKARH